MDESLEQAVVRCKTLPSLPVVAAQVIDVINRDDFGLNDIAAVVSNDIAISAKLVAIANSAAYRRGDGSSDVNHAISRLGVKATVMTALSFSLATSLRETDSRGIDADTLWKRSALAASIARLLAQQLRLPNAEACFLAALVQDIGVLVLNQVSSTLYESLPEPTHECAVKTETAELHCDHAAVGSWLLLQWRFPEAVAGFVATSHQFPELTTEASLRKDHWCVAASGVLADVLLQGNQLGLARTLSLLDGMCSQHEPARVELAPALAACVEEAEGLFETALVPNTTELLESSKALLFEHMMAGPLEAQSERLGELEDRVTILEQQSRMDPLTGAYNRAYFDKALERLFAGAQSNGESISLMFVDADHFKQINDTYGHLAGDEALKWIAATLKSLVRDTDVVARYGGEEFVVILPTLSESDAVSFGGRIGAKLRNGTIRVASADIRLTASIGIACAGGASAIETTSELTRAADQAMYFAKQSGRDLCIGASALPPVAEQALAG